MNIAIAGYGLEGESNYRYWSADKNNHLTIFNEVQPEIELPVDCNAVIGYDAFSKMNGFDLVVRTAGLAPRKIKTDGKIWSATNEFLAKCPAKIIGVTGTKGKGTTASLIASILEADGKKVWLVGNIGRPALDSLLDIKPDDFVVYEMSSFQLWDIERSPQVAVVLMIEPDHLNVHSDMDEYVNAKSNIAKFQKQDDLLVYNKNNNYSMKIADKSNATKIAYIDNKFAYVEDNYFYYGRRKLCGIDSLKIVGDHNIDNACAAIDAVWSLVDNDKSIEKGLCNFSGLKHRLKFIREVNGVKYYDDSIATTPGSAIAALRSFSQPKILILGGSLKGADFEQLGVELTKHEVKVVLMGENIDLIIDSCERASFIDFEVIDNPTMIKVVNRASEIAKAGDIVILSPASASFGLFKNYADRGDQFINAVKDL